MYYTYTFYIICSILFLYFLHRITFLFFQLIILRYLLILILTGYFLLFVIMKIIEKQTIHLNATFTCDKLVNGNINVNNSMDDNIFNNILLSCNNDRSNMVPNAVKANSSSTNDTKFDKNSIFSHGNDNNSEMVDDNININNSTTDNDSDNNILFSCNINNKICTTLPTILHIMI